MDGEEEGVWYYAAYNVVGSGGGRMRDWEGVNKPHAPFRTCQKRKKYEKGA